MQDEFLNINRRKFLASASATTGAFLLPFSSLALGKKHHKRITILHTNDTHSHIDPFPADHRNYGGQGGVSARARMINQVREEEEQVLLLDAGDIFQGTPYFNRYGGVLELKLMSEMGYDAATIGNHDFDGGMEGFVRAQTEANFPFICSNYDFKNTPLEGRTKRTQVFQKGDLKIGVFGIGIELKGLVPDKFFGETKVNNAIEVATDCVNELQAAGCDLIICLSHLGYAYQTNRVSDHVLAQNTSGIHLIIGGHTHTFLDRPTEVKNKLGLPVLINQVGWAGLKLGRIEFEVSKEIRLKNIHNSVLDLK